MRDAPTGASDATTTRQLVLNPTSGRGDHVERAHEFATDHGFDVVETDHRGHATELAREAVADGVDHLGVCGGDGTLQEVVVGLYEAGALDAVTLCLVPAGTENFVARELGIESMEDGFQAAAGGSTLHVDVGIADDEPFVMSAVAGLPAEVSAAATHDLKQRFGELAFVAGAVEEGLAFDGARVDVDVHSTEGEVEWTGEVLALLLGNVRTFTDRADPDHGEGTGPDNVEGTGPDHVDDGLLEVALVEEMSTLTALFEAAEQRLLDAEPENVTVLQATGLDVAGLDGEPLTYSLDGEIRSFERVRFDVLPSALEVNVASEYAPDEG